MTDRDRQSGRTRGGASHDFDNQAGDFDRRAGIGDDLAGKVAASVLGVAGLAAGDVLVEMGCGTGEIGRFLAAGHGGYLGLDVSQEMLRVARTRAEAAGVLARWMVADGENRWPLADGSVGCVFVSRAAHLLDRDHLIAEMRRVGGKRLYFFVGRVRRSAGGYKELLRERMRRGLTDRGLAAREGRFRSDRLIEVMVERGFERIPTIDVARWSKRGRPADVLRDWRAKEKLGGVAMEAAAAGAVLGEVEHWARDRFGDLDVVLEQEEVYTLTGARRSN